MYLGHVLPGFNLRALTSKRAPTAVDRAKGNHPSFFLKRQELGTVCLCSLVCCCGVVSRRATRSSALYGYPIMTVFRPISLPQCPESCRGGHEMKPREKKDGCSKGMKATDDNVGYSFRPIRDQNVKMLEKGNADFNRLIGSQLSLRPFVAKGTFPYPRALSY